MRSLYGVIALVALLLFAAPARAVFHLWQISEIYSNQDGSIQFVEFFTNASFQGQLAGHALTSASFQSVFTLPSGLPSNTANHFFLVATPDFAGAAGITPDYTLPNALFFDFDGDTVQLVGADAITFVSGELPLDGILSLQETFGGGSRSTAPNSPTNFAGAVGAIVPEPGTGTLLALGLVLLAGGRVGAGARASRTRLCGSDGRSPAHG